MKNGAGSFFLKKRADADFTISRLLLGSGVDLGMRFVGLVLVFGVHSHPALFRAFLKGIVLAGLPELLELTEGAQGDASREGFLGQRRRGRRGFGGSNRLARGFGRVPSASDWRGRWNKRPARRDRRLLVENRMREGRRSDRRRKEVRPVRDHPKLVRPQARLGRRREEVRPIRRDVEEVRRDDRRALELGLRPAVRPVRDVRRRARGVRRVRFEGVRCRA